MELLRFMPAARWLSTSQAHRRFFGQASMSAARRRLRQLGKAGFLCKNQEDRMREALFTLGREGKRWLEGVGTPEIRLERRPPKQLDHLMGINDIRIAAELTGRISFFFAAWELPGIGWKYPLVPDAVFRLADRTFAAEFDRGAEGIRFFVRTKITVYRRTLVGFPLAAVLVVADGRVRMRALARAAADDHQGRFLFTTIDAIRDRGLLARIFYRAQGSTAESLGDACSIELSCREDSSAATS